MAKRTKAEMQGLKEGNKAVKTLSGAITQVRTFWSKGYKKAFAEIGLKFEDIDFKKLEPILQKNTAGLIYTVESVRVKNTEGNYIKDEKGHYLREDAQVAVTMWTANKLFDCCKQSLNK
jgi:hypothetical protein